MRWAPRSAIDKFEREWNYDARFLREMLDASPRAAWLFLRVTSLLAAAALAGGFGLAAPAAAQGSAQPAVDAYTLTTGRLVGTVAALVALAGAVIGGLALARSAGRIGTGNGRRGAIVALVLGPIGLVIGGVVVAAAEGGPGTGYGIVGGFAALAIGLIATVLGGLALARSRRTGLTRSDSSGVTSPSR